MIIVKMRGGLGNQLFQYAAAYALAQKNDVPLKMDLTGYGVFGDKNSIPKNLHRTPDILDFSVSATCAELDEVEDYRRDKFGVFSKKWKQLKYKYLVNYYIDFHRKIVGNKNKPYLDEYFLSEKYFCNYSGDILGQFKLQPKTHSRLIPIIEKIKSFENPVSIHVRRGDFVENEHNRHHLSICDDNYYQRAMEKMHAMVGDFTPVIFSDDIEWVESNMSFGPHAFYPGKSTLADGGPISTAQEMVLMSKCEHNLIANSTFSWWGAYSNANPNKVIIAPSKWFRDLRGYKKIVPASWVKIPVT